jgi:hypothetical protein
MVPIIGPVLCGTFFLTLCQTMMVSGTGFFIVRLSFHEKV